jgi:APA family basic amino acid/polyamine antiporter
MAKNGDLPRALALVHPVHSVPHRAIAIAGAAAAVLAAFGGITTAISLSSFFVLIYYAIANASALTLKDRPRILPLLGLTACLLIALSVAFA